MIMQLYRKVSNFFWLWDEQAHVPLAMTRATNVSLLLEKVWCKPSQMFQHITPSKCYKWSSGGAAELVIIIFACRSSNVQMRKRNRMFRIYAMLIQAACSYDERSGEL